MQKYDIRSNKNSIGDGWLWQQPNGRKRFLLSLAIIALLYGFNQFMFGVDPQAYTAKAAEAKHMQVGQTDPTATTEPTVPTVTTEPTVPTLTTEPTVPTVTGEPTVPTLTVTPPTPTKTKTPTKTPTNTPETPTETPTNTPETPTETPTNTATETPTNTPETSTETPTNTPTKTPETSTETPTNTPTKTPDTPTKTPTPSLTPTNTPVLAIKQYYVSSSNNSKVENKNTTVRFSDEDILVYDVATDTWSIFFDGSDVKIGRTDVDAFFILDDGSILMSFVHAINFPAPLGKVDDSDIVKFIPTQLGATTAGSFELYFDGSDVGLETGNEDIDAMGFAPDGRLLISTYGAVNVPGVSGGKDEDIIAFTITSLGATTQGTWALYFDGSDVQLIQGSEDVTSAYVYGPTGDLYLTTRGNYVAQSNNTISGDQNDVFRCVPQSLGDTTVCTFSAVFNGDAIRFFKRIDGLYLKWGATAQDLLTVQSATLLEDDIPQYEVDADDLDFTDPEVDEFDDAQEAENSTIALPLIHNSLVNREVPDDTLPLPLSK